MGHGQISDTHGAIGLAVMGGRHLHGKPPRRRFRHTPADITRPTLLAALEFLDGDPTHINDPVPSRHGILENLNRVGVHIKRRETGYRGAPRAVVGLLNKVFHSSAFPVCTGAKKI